MKNSYMVPVSLIFFFGAVILLASSESFNNNKKIMFKSGIVERIQNDSILSRELLLDSTVMRIQAKLLESDSIMSVYILNQMELRPILTKRTVYNLHRHKYMDDEALKFALDKIRTDEIIACCL